MSSTRLLVLGAVRIFQPVHGYDVRRELLSWRVDQWANVAPGSIYNALKTLTKEKFLKVAGTGQIGGRPERTQYSLTADGEKEYQALLRATWWKVAPPLDELMPALCFMPSSRARGADRGARAPDSARSKGRSSTSSSRARRSLRPRRPSTSRSSTTACTPS